MLLTITKFRTEINRDINVQAIFALLLYIKRIPIYTIPEKLHVSVCESVYIYCDVPGSPCLSKNKANQVCDSCFSKFLSSRCLPNLLIFKGLLYIGLVHLWTDQRIPGPVSCRCPGGSLDTPPRWHVTISLCEVFHKKCN